MNKIKEMFALFIFLCTILMLGSCNSHTHTYIWEYNTVNHWQVCTECNEKKDVQMHSFGDFTVLTEATETEAGKKQRLCGLCGYKEIEEIPCLEHTHTYGAWEIVLLPTEFSEGEILKTCTVNSEHIKRASLPVLNTTDYKYTVITEPDCIKPGLAEYLFVYDGEELQVLIEISALPHSFGPWETKWEATATASGLKTRSCSLCGFEEEEVIPPLEHTHTYGAWTVEVEPTLLRQGSLLRICSQNNEHIEKMSLPALNDVQYVCQEIEAATCGSEGRARYCIEIQNQEFIFYSVTERLEHSFSEDWIRDEVYHYHGAICEHSDEKKDFGEHSFTDGICSICGYPRVSVGLDYRLNPDGLSYCVAGIGSSADTAIVIPQVYNGFPVTALAAEAFKNCSQIESIRFLGDVEEIGASAFSGCLQLSSVYFEGVQRIGDNAFEACSSLKGLTLPDTVQSIGAYAFLNCRNLEVLELPAGLLSLGDYAFSGCDKLIFNTYNAGLYLGNSNNPYLVLVKSADTNITSCEIHEDTVFIYDSAFSECLQLGSIVIPNAVVSIGHHAFFLCVALQSAVIGKGVKHIGQSAFANCESLTTVILQDTLERIDANAFYKCEAIETADYVGTETAWSSVVVAIGNSFLVSALRFTSQ